MSKLHGQLAAAREAMSTSQGYDAEMGRIAEERAAEARERRVEHLTQLAIRRIHRKDVARGMSAWIDMWYDVTHTRAMLARVSARLVRPKMVLAYAHWRISWDGANAEQSKQSVQQRLASEVLQPSSPSHPCDPSP